MDPIGLELVTWKMSMVLFIMKLYPIEVKKRAVELRKNGYTTKEINEILKLNIPKSTYSGWFKTVIVNEEGKNRLTGINIDKLNKARSLAVSVNKEARKKFLNSLDDKNLDIALKINNIDFAKMALSMLCLGEASKHKNGSAFSLGNTDPRIIILFIKLLNKCFDIDWSKFRCTVMCRADQNISELENYWQRVTHIPKRQFYATRVDNRSLGKKTKKIGYMGVLKVDYLNTKTQLDLESLANLIYNQVK